MAFTLTHPLVILPLIKPMKKHAVISALVIGSMIPDLVYYLPWMFPGINSHQFSAAFWFAIPAGLLVYLVYHLLATPGLLLLLPANMVSKLGLAKTAGQLPDKPWSKVCLCLLIGALTHLGWDELTHHSEIFPFVNRVLFHAGQNTVTLHGVLHVSTSVAGLWVLLRILYKRYQALPDSGELPIAYDSRIKCSARLMLLLLPAVAAILNIVLLASKWPLSAIVVDSIFVSGGVFIVIWLLISLLFISISGVRKQSIAQGSEDDRAGY